MCWLIHDLDVIFSQILYPEYEVRNLLLWKSLYLSSPLIVFDSSSNSGSSDTSLTGHQEIFTDSPQHLRSDSRPITQRRNSDGDVTNILLNPDSRHNTGPEFRDDTNSELYLGKALSFESNFEPTR